MADAIVAVAIEKLTDVLVQQLALFAGATNELRKIRRSLKHIEAVLHDAESMQVTQERVRLWLSELRQVAYDIEDLIDEHLENDASGSHCGNGECAATCLPSPLTCFHRGVSRYQLGRSVQEMRERLDQIARDKEQFSISQMSSSSDNTRPVSSSRMKEQMIGRDDDEKAVLSRLLGRISSTDDVDEWQPQQLVGEQLQLGSTYNSSDEEDRQLRRMVSESSRTGDDDGQQPQQQQQLIGASSGTGDDDGQQPQQQQQLIGASSSTGDDDGQQPQQQQQLIGTSSGTGDDDGQQPQQQQQLIGASSSTGDDDGQQPQQQQQLIGTSNSSTGDEDEQQQQQQLVGAGTCTGDESRRQQEEVVSVIAILGIGGLGKTTLARKIYSHYRVRRHFKDALCWISVSENFDEKRIMKAVIEQVRKQSTSLSEPEALQDELESALEGRRFLLVLDDVWNVHESKWNALQPCLASGAPGSRILVTTRLQMVAKETMKAAYIHRLKGLSYYNSWNLFRTIALDRRDNHEYRRLENLAREIVRKCRGVPLSIKTMGILMSSKWTVEDWRNILKSNIWSFREFENGILPALWLSYHNLPSQLKQCFVYCSIYQKGSVMYKDELVRMWIAQGFIRQQGNRSIEAIGGEYVDDLVEWSMLQQVSKNKRGKAISCKMHDLLHDLARFIAKDEIYTTIISNNDEQSAQGPSNNLRHKCLYFAYHNDMPITVPIVFRGAKKLRTLWLYGVDGLGNVIVEFLLQARFLRVLVFRGFMPSKFSDSDMVRLLNAIGKLKHLRYLDVSGLNMKELPEAVSHLRNLHTFNLTCCRQLKKLPSDIGKIVSLRYLEIKGTNSLEYLPPGLGNLSDLRSLCKFIVGGVGGCSIDELKQLNSLEGSLEIEHLERVPSKEAAEKAQLLNKQHLSRLVLRTLGTDDVENERTKSVLEGRLPRHDQELLEGLWSHGKLEEELEGFCAPDNLEEVFDGLRPHGNLEELEVCRYTGSKLPRWINEIRCLKILRLRICPKLKKLLHHANASLTHLVIEDCDAIEGLESSSFRSLENLTLINSSKFLSKGLPDLWRLKTLEIHIYKNETLPNEGWEQLEELHNLKITHCNELKSLPNRLMGVIQLQYLHISYCDKLESLPENSRKLELNYLEIWECKAMRSLPAGFRNLRGLQGLSIDGCPLLSDRCKIDGGEDWPKISHIPYISVNGKCIQQ